MFLLDRSHNGAMVSQGTMTADSTSNIDESVTPEKLVAFGCTTFDGNNEDPIDADNWIQEIEYRFEILACNDEQHQVKLASLLLKGDAAVWWSLEHKVHVGVWTWEEFKRVFYSRYFPDAVRARLSRQFTLLRQGNMTVWEYHILFSKLSRFSHRMENEKAKAFKFLEGLDHEIRYRCASSSPNSYIEARDMAYRVETCHMFSNDDDQRKSSDMFEEQRDHKKHRPMTLQSSSVYGFGSRGSQQSQRGGTYQGEQFDQHNTNSVVCYNCGMVGHKRNQCPTPY